MKYLIVAVLFTFLSSCGSDSEEIRILASIQIESSNGAKLDVSTSETTKLTVKGFDQLGGSFVIDDSISWSADNNNTSIDEMGLVTALAEGSSVITAEVQGIQSTIRITVWDRSAPRIEIYVSDVGNPIASPPFQILKYDENGQNPEVFTNQNLDAPQDIIFLEKRNEILISNWKSGRIGRYDINTGRSIGSFASGLGQPTRMKIGPDSLLYVLQWSGNALVLRYQLDGTFVDEFTSVPVSQSIGMDWDTSGNLYVSSFSGGNGGFVRKFNTNGVDQGLFIADLQGPTDIWFKSGELWINDWQAGAIYRYNSQGTFIERVATGLIQNEGVDFFRNGNFLIGIGGPGSVKLFNKDGGYIKDFITAGSGGLLSPNAVKIRYVNQ